MRTFNRTQKDPAFTLIELVVVIAIIATLAAFLFPVLQNMLVQAKKTQAKNDVIQIVTAVNAYYTEYGKYPLATSDGSADTRFGLTLTNEALFDVLRATGLGRDTVNALDTSGNVNLNLRRIVFISPPDVKSTASPKSGIGTNRQFYDPWGSTYKIVIDGNYDNQITTNPYTDTDGSAGASPLRIGVIAYSYGQNGAVGGGAAASASFSKESGTGGNYKSSGDVLSWQ